MMSAGSPQPSLHGYLIIDKPAGWTSHDVVARVRRLLGEKRVGHAGTLDPAATGVLPLAVGDATKTLQWLSEAGKTYIADITFGVATDSIDADGVVVDQRPLSPDLERRLPEALSTFHGEIEQIPPMHSAIKVHGRRLYELARAGEIVERTPRRITIHRIELLAWNPPTATIIVECSKGTYIRSLSADVAEWLGTIAHLSNLVRVRSGPFGIDEAWTLGDLEGVESRAEWPLLAVHPDAGMHDQDAIVIDAESAADWSYGRPVLAAIQKPGVVRVYSGNGAWLGVGEFDPAGLAWMPVKVVPAA